MALYQHHDQHPAGIVRTGLNVIYLQRPGRHPADEPEHVFLGIVIDPYGKITELSLPNNVFEDVTVVGPSSSGLSSAGVVFTPNNNPFPVTAERDADRHLLVDAANLAASLTASPLP